MGTEAISQVSLVEVKPSYDARLLQLVLTAVVVGLVMAFSASYPNASQPGANSLPGDAFRYFRLQAIFAAVGLVAMWVVSRIPPRVFERTSLVGFGCFCGLTLLTVVIGHKTRGEVLFLHLGPIRFQPTEFTKLFFIAYVASRLSLGPLRRKTFRTVGRPILVAAGIYCLLLLLEGDQGMMVLVFLITLAMCFLGGLSGWTTAGLLGLGGGLASILAFTSQVRADRIWAWLDPVKYKTGAGFHILTMLVAIARGGQAIWGLGLGMSPDKWRQMPEPHTDSIFCVLGSELGLIGVALFLFLMGWLVLRIFQIARWSRDSFGYFLAAGLGAMIGLQAMINMFVATNLMPVTGLTLPYISYGGSSLITCLLAAGMVLSVYRHNPPLTREE